MEGTPRPRALPVDGSREKLLPRRRSRPGPEPTWRPTGRRCAPTRSTRGSAALLPTIRSNRNSSWTRAVSRCSRASLTGALAGGLEGVSRSARSGSACRKMVPDAQLVHLGTLGRRRAVEPECQLACAASAASGGARPHGASPDPAPLPGPGRRGPIRRRPAGSAPSSASPKSRMPTEQPSSPARKELATSSATWTAQPCSST